MHDITCSNPDELIAITDKASFAVAPGGVQALLVHPDGRVQTASASTKPTDGQILLVATGKRAAELAGHAAQQDARAFIDLSYRALDPRSEERRVGKECVSTCRFRWSQAH